MGFAISTFLWDYIRQGILVLLAAALFFGSVWLVSSDDFHQRYYAKDVGLVLDASHAARGDVTIDYDKLLHRYDFQTTMNSLELKTPLNDEWEFRKRVPLDRRGASLQEEWLEQPALLTVLRQGDSLSLTTTGVTPATCPVPEPRPAKVTTQIVVEGVSSLLTTSVGKIGHEPDTVVDTITFRIEQTPTLEPALVVATATNTALGDSVVCNLQAALQPYEVATAMTTQGSETVVTFTHPPAPGLDDDKLASALLITLDEVLS